MRKAKIICTMGPASREEPTLSRLVEAGMMERLVPEAEVERAVSDPPEDTRAYFRGRCIEKYQDSIIRASWDSVMFEIAGSLQRVPTREPLRGTSEHVEALIEASDTAAELIDALQN